MIDEALIQRLLAKHGLPEAFSIRRIERGINNPIFIVNEALVLRFDGLAGRWDHSRFAMEARIYERLAIKGVPVPQVFAVDEDHDLFAGDVLLMSAAVGDALIEAWPGLSEMQREGAANEAGRWLARIHTVTFPRWGQIHAVEEGGGFAHWADYVADRIERHSAPCLQAGTLDEATYERLRAFERRCQPYFAVLSTPVLVHADYHFENIVQRGGQITAIVDWEWSLAGDPAYDFAVEDQWAATFHGAKEMVYAAYTLLHGLGPGFAARVALYKMLRDLDDVQDYTGTPQRERVEAALGRIRAELTKQRA